MKRILRSLAIVFFGIAVVIALITYRDEENEGEIVKAFRDPDRVDKRWVYVAALGTAAICLTLWSVSKKGK